MATDGFSKSQQVKNEDPRISGLENSVSFKRTHWPRLDDREYRISQGHDAAAALVIDGKLVAASEQERFCRKKHTGEFPIDAIHHCLSAAASRLRTLTKGPRL